MQFIQRDGAWVLIDETAPPNANVIATVNGPVEVLALRGLCEARVGATGPILPFGVTFGGRSYRVTPFADRGGRLSLRLDGDDGSISRVETEFSWPGG